MNSFPGKVIGVLLCFILLILAPLVITALSANIRVERVTWNALTSYVDVLADRGIITHKDYEEFIANLGASTVNYEVTITIQSRYIVPAVDAAGNIIPGSYTIRYTTTAAWRSSSIIPDGVPLRAGDNVQVIINPLNNSAGDNVLARMLGIYSSQRRISFARAVRNTGDLP